VSLFWLPEDLFLFSFLRLSMQFQPIYSCFWYFIYVCFWYFIHVCLFSFIHVFGILFMFFVYICLPFCLFSFIHVCFFLFSIYSCLFYLFFCSFCFLCSFSLVFIISSCIRISCFRNIDVNQNRRICIVRVKRIVKNQCNLVFVFVLFMFFFVSFMFFLFYSCLLFDFIHCYLVWF